MSNPSKAGGEMTNEQRKALDDLRAALDKQDELSAQFLALAHKLATNYYHLAGAIRKLEEASA